MAAVTLVCTSHSERGNSNEDALLRILCSLDPDVIFLELRSFDAAALAMQMPEARAARRYATLRPSEQLAVDEFDIPASFRGDVDALFDYVEENSDEFIALVQQRDFAASLGFEAMNSADFEELAEKCDRAMERAVVLSRSKELMSRHANWTSLLRRREESMLSNIYRFCRSRPDSRGAFLVGAAHISALLKSIEAHIAREPEVIEWEIWNRPGRFSGRTRSA